MQVNKIQTLFHIQQRNTCLFKVETLPVSRPLGRDWKKKIEQNSNGFDMQMTKICKQHHLPKDLTHATQ